MSSRKEGRLHLWDLQVKGQSEVFGMLLAASIFGNILSPVCHAPESDNRQVEHTACLGDGISVFYNIKLAILSHAKSGSYW